MTANIANNQYSYNYSQDNVPGVVQDYQRVRHFVHKTGADVTGIDNKLMFTAFETLPPFRRISSLPDKVENRDYLPALGLASLAFINLPEDWRDIKGAGRQIWSKVNKNYKYDPIYDRKNYQHSFSFFRGTLLDKPLKAQRDKGKKWAKKLIALDKTIFKSKLGDFLVKKFDIEIEDRVKTSIKNANGKAARASKFGGNAFKQLTGRAMKRLPLLSVIALGVLELPKIFKAHKKGDTALQKADEMTKQTVKSAVNATSTLAGIGYGGAIGAKYGGAAGSLIGMGVGAVLGGEASQRLQGLIA